MAKSLLAILFLSAWNLEGSGFGPILGQAASTRSSPSSGTTGPPADLSWYNPMFDFMTRGFDVRTQTLHNITRDPAKWKKQIVAYDSTELGSSVDWTDPATKKTYKMPKTVQEVSIDKQASLTTRVEFFNSFEDLQPLLFPNNKSVQIPGDFVNQFYETSQTGYAKAEVRIYRFKYI